MVFLRDGLLAVLMNWRLRETENFVQMHFTDQLIGGSGPVLTQNLGHNQARAIAVVTSAEFNLYL
jgi:hypothetical protein